MKWFKHDSDANMDAKLQEVLLDYGLEGYGLYWYCIELIVGKIEKEKITFELEHDARIIARNTGCTVQKVEEMMKVFIDLGLFENSKGKITCMKIAKRLDKSMTSNPDMRIIIENLKNHDTVMTQSDLTMIESEKVMQDKIRLDKNINTFAQFWSSYPKKKSKGAAEKAWKRLKPDEQLVEKIISSIELAKTSEDWVKDSGKYIPYPATWLNAHGWEDEIQSSEPQELIF
jgi:tRNA 2-selenouridine synthase SelU